MASLSEHGVSTADDETTALLSATLPQSELEPPIYGTPGNRDEDLSLRLVATGSEEEIDESAEEGQRNAATENSDNANAVQNDDDASTADDQERNGTIGLLTRRLRCLFSTITWPIVPLGTIVALALLWVLYAASSLDLKKSCSHPLHWYALASLVLVAYIPHHAQVRSHMFQYSRERDGPIRPARVRMYDQFFHTICLLYVYTGVTLMQSCRSDILSPESLAALLEDQELDGFPSDTPPNSCAATCPSLYQALSVYVATLEMFTFALILPLLFLPCIYLWFLRRATAEAEAFAQLQDRLQEDEALLSNGGVTTGEILDDLQNVKIVTMASSVEPDERQIWVVPFSAMDPSQGTKCNTKECCICMNEFDIQDEADLETGVTNETAESTAVDDEETTSSSGESTQSAALERKDRSIVRTHCGHIFHEECLAGWVSGRWQMSTQSNNGSTLSQERRRRRARQTGCPLCREDLRPHNPS